jgi:hypothetical protein
MAHCAVRTIAAAATLIAAACSQPLNTAPVLDRSVPLDTITPWPSVYASEIPPLPPVELGEERSVVSVERRNWEPTLFLVPVAGVRHLPHYTSEAPVLAHETARQRGEYPTIRNCLEMGTTRSDHLQACEFLLQPFYCAGQVVLALPRAIATPPWKPIWSPVEPYARAPQKPLRLSPPDRTAVTEPESAPIAAAPGRD